MNLSDFLHDMRVRANRREADERVAWWADVATIVVGSVGVIWLAVVG
jgi:hypothetical protein